MDQEESFHFLGVGGRNSPESAGKVDVSIFIQVTCNCFDAIRSGLIGITSELVGSRTKEVSRTRAGIKLNHFIVIRDGLVEFESVAVRNTAANVRRHKFGLELNHFGVIRDGLVVVAL